MKQTRSDAGFLETISEEAHIPERDVKPLLADFLSALSGFVSEEVIELLIDITPTDVNIERGGDRDSNATIEEFLLEMSDEEGVATGRAAEHARVVAEGIRSRAHNTDLRRLRDLIENEDILALFELNRGELTETEPSR